MTYHVVEGGGLEYSNYGPSAQFSTSAPLSRYGYAGLSVTPQTSPERHAHTTTVSHAGPAHDAGTAAYLRDRRTNTRLTSTVPGGIDFAPPGAGGRPKQPGRGVPRAGLMPDPAIPLEVIDILIDVFGNPVEPRMKMPLVPKPTPRAKKDRAARRRNQHKIKRCLKVWRSKKTKPNCPRPPSFRDEDPGEPRGRTGGGRTPPAGPANTRRYRFHARGRRYRFRAYEAKPPHRISAEAPALEATLEAWQVQAPRAWI